MRSALLLLSLGCGVLALAAPAHAGTPTSFDPGALVIPMDPTWQDDGIVDAYGLAYAILQQGIQVHWVMDAAKAYDGDDLVDVSTYLSTETSADAVARTFSGGPFVVAAADAAAAQVILDAWQAAGWGAVAYYTTDTETMEVSRTMYVAPSIVIFEDGNEDIAWDYLNAAGIPDYDGNTWEASSPYNVSETEMEGPDPTVAGDGGLFDAEGYAAYCHLNAMHYEQTSISGIVMEIRAFAEDTLTSSLFECVASESIENDPEGLMISGGVTEVGINRGRATWTVSDPGNELVQMVGAWGDVGGSLADFDGTFNSDVQFLSGDDGTDVSQVLAYGRLDGDPLKGKIALMAGHEYDPSGPYSANDEINGVRVFLNSYFTADCANLALAPVIDVDGTFTTASLTATLTLDYDNSGTSRARSSELTLTIPAGMSYVSDDSGGVYDPVTNTVTWDLGTLSSGEAGSIVVELVASADGTYTFDADLDYRVEASYFSEDWTGDVTVGLDTDGDGVTDVDEVTDGTDPVDPDTDGDGLDDGDEASTGTDPLVTDTDGDGLSDGEETTAGTDPLDTDSDDDGLTDGDEVDVYVTDPLDTDTDDDGLDDAEEIAEGTDPGVADTDSDGLYDGEEVDDVGSDPNDADTDGDGIEDGDEIDITETDPLDADTDDDGLDDGDEVDVHGTDPLDEDSDGDGLEDGDEVTRGTDPNDADTDDGGVSDGGEVTNGTDPLDGTDDFPPTGDEDGDGLTNEEEAGLGTDATDADTDGDGLTDGDEVDVYGTDPADADSDDGGTGDGVEVIVDGTDPNDPTDDVINTSDRDGDGLTDAEEFVLGTDPDLPDTDGDGLGDGEETVTDPTDPDTDDDGLLDGEETVTDPTDPDTDDDGLSDGEEDGLGTDPNDPDSDDDGLSDGEEVNDHDSDPLDADTDDDGLSDGDEVDVHGTDPTDADTDDGGVGDGDEVRDGTDPLDPSDDLGGDDSGDTDDPQDTGDTDDPQDTGDTDDTDVDDTDTDAGDTDTDAGPDTGGPDGLVDEKGNYMGGACGCATPGDGAAGAGLALGLALVARRRRSGV